MPLLLARAHLLGSSRLKETYAIVCEQFALAAAVTVAATVVVSGRAFFSFPEADYGVSQEIIVRVVYRMITCTTYLNVH